MNPRTLFSLCTKFGCLLALGACSSKMMDTEAATVPAGIVLVENP